MKRSLRNLSDENSRKFWDSVDEVAKKVVVNFPEWKLGGRTFRLGSHREKEGNNFLKKAEPNFDSTRKS